MNVRACLITNPRSGRGGIDLSPVIPILKAHGWEVEVRHKLKGGMATELARQAAKEGFSVVINCGGDGTLNEIVNGLVGTEVAIGSLPGGTVNLWCKEMGISPDLAGAALQLVGGVRRRVDVGHLSLNHKKGQYFLLMAGLGFDGTVISNVSKPLKNRIGKLEVGLAGVKSLPSFKPIFLQIEMDEISWQGKTGQVVIGNTRQYGGFTSFTPQAYINDGLLDICILPETSPLGVSRQIFDLLVKKHPDLQDAQIFRAAQIKIQSDIPLKVQVDGGKADLDDKLSSKGKEYLLSVVPQGVNVLVPSTYNDELFLKEGELPQMTGQKLKVYGDGDTPEAAKPEQAEKVDPKSKKVRKVTICILETGIDQLIGVRLKKRKQLFTIVVNEQTILKKAGEKRKGLNGVLAALKEGDYIKVKGQKTAEKTRLVADRISIKVSSVQGK
jgi:YegS/Rv2252/BmrU family lipid kinase